MTRLVGVPRPPVRYWHDVDLGAGRRDLQPETLQLVVPQEGIDFSPGIAASTARLVIAGIGLLR